MVEAVMQRGDTHSGRGHTWLWEDMAVVERKQWQVDKWSKEGVGQKLRQHLRS